jgi:hypothetical protein
MTGVYRVLLALTQAVSASPGYATHYSFTSLDVSLMKETPMTMSTEIIPGF